MKTISLHGEWRAVLKHENKADASACVHLPGVLAAQGLGDDVTLDTKWVGSIFDPAYFTAPEYARWREPGNIKVPFFLQPEKYFAGVVEYEREFEVPEAWVGKRIVLTLERVHWESRVWVDGAEVGRCDSLSVPHVFDLGNKLSAGRHALRLSVDNRVLKEIGVNSHSITDHTQGNWNGVIGRMELSVTETAWIEDVQVFPRVASKSVLVRGRVCGDLSKELLVDVGNIGGNPLNQNGVFEREVSLGEKAHLWDEFMPKLHSVTVSLSNGEARTVRFGLREIGVKGTQFTMNDRPLFLRGTLECAVWPRTGHPPVDVESWRKLLRTVRAHGLNHIRFHSWCPPEAAFVAGDEEGFYFQIEAASWPNQGSTVGDGRDDDAWIVRESDRIVRAYGNHPSFVFFASCNEPDGPRSREWLTYWTGRMKASSGGRQLHACSSGWPEIGANDFHVNHMPRMHQWLDNLKSRINALPPETRTDYRDYIEARGVPVVSHEIGQWCVYPNFAEMDKYSGYLKPRNFEIFRESLAEHGMADQAADFVRASGRLQALCYKEEIESALRTPGMGGFQLLGLSDFSGQGTALVGVLDSFWEEKGYIAPDVFARFCRETVPLARLERRVFEAGDEFVADVELAHFGSCALKDVEVRWSLGDAWQETWRIAEVPTGKLSQLGQVRVSFPAVREAKKFSFIVNVAGYENDWDVWVFPKECAVSERVHVTSQWDEAAQAVLRDGGAVVLSVAATCVKLGFSSIFWNTAWTNQQAPHTLGILCDPKHPALSGFPTEFCSNWQWWYVIRESGAMILDALPRELRPIVQVIDDWFTNRKLGLVFEARVGAGRLIVSSVDLNADNPVVRQLRASLLRYAASRDFAPKCEVSVAGICGLFTAQ